MNDATSLRTPPAAHLRGAGLAGALLLVAACGDGGTRPAAAPGADAPPSAPAPDAGPGPGADHVGLARAAYDRGLDFLAQLQKDGRWSVEGQPNVGFTALCATNFLERPGGLRETDRHFVDASLAWIAQSLAADGGVDGSPRPNYETSVAVMALAASGRAEFRPLVERGAAYLKGLQRLEDGNPTWGGIGYGSDSTRSDLSNTQYALASLRAAGVPESDPVFQRAVTFLQRVQNRRENESGGEPAEWTDAKSGKRFVRSDDGGANYYPGNSKAGADERPDGVGVLRSYGSMTYALLRCYHFAGLDATDPRVEAALRWIARNWTLDHNPGMSGKDQYSGLFYMYATLGRALPLAKVDALDTPGGAVHWRSALTARLAQTQRDDGSWLNEHSARWDEGNPILATSFALTALAPCAQ